MIQIAVVNAKKEPLASAQGEHSAYLVYQSAYAPGDAITLNCHAPNVFVHIWLEDSMQPALVFSPTGMLYYPIPPADNRLNHSPKSFTGQTHLIRAWLATKEALSGERCLSFNPYDGHQAEGYFPHATANVETRGEAVFFARNAIDGIFANDSHGGYPYQSWGINRDPNAALALSFGRDVLINEVRLTIRCDFPHDSWWTSATLCFSGGEERTVALQKAVQPQSFQMGGITASSVTLKNLVKADDPSPFPALTQLEIIGKEI